MGIIIRGMSIGLDLLGLTPAMDAMYDIYEKGLLRDFEFVWYNGYGERAWVDDYFFSQDFDRESFRYNADKNLFSYCIMSGFSDRLSKRKVDIIWDPRRGRSLIWVILHGGAPCRASEERIFEVIASRAYYSGM